MSKAFALLALLAASPTLAQSNPTCTTRGGGPAAGGTGPAGIAWQLVHESCDADDRVTALVIARADARLRAIAKARSDSGLHAPTDPLRETLAGPGIGVAFTTGNESPTLGVRFSTDIRTLDILYETRDRWTTLPRIQLEPTDSVLVVLVDGSAGPADTPDVVGRVMLPRTPMPALRAGADPSAIKAFVDQLVARSAVLRDFVAGAKTSR